MFGFCSLPPSPLFLCTSHAPCLHHTTPLPHRHTQPIPPLITTPLGKQKEQTYHRVPGVALQFPQLWHRHVTFSYPFSWPWNSVVPKTMQNAILTGAGRGVTLARARRGVFEGSAVRYARVRQWEVCDRPPAVSRGVQCLWSLVRLGG